MAPWAVAPALALVATLAAAGDPCEALLDRPPRDPYSCECFRASGDARRLLEQRLRGWLAQSPGDPWLLAALGAHHVEHEPARAREALASAVKIFASLGQSTGESYARLLLARDFQRRRLVDEVRREMTAAESLARPTGDPVLEGWLALLAANELGFASRHEEALVAARRATLEESFASLPRSLRYGLLQDAVESAYISGSLSEAVVFARRAAGICGDRPGCRIDETYAISRITSKMATAGLATRADAEQRAREAYDAAREGGGRWAEIDSLCTLGAWALAPQSIEWNQLCMERALAMGCPDLRRGAQLLHAEATAMADPSEIGHSIRILEQILREQRRFIGDPDVAFTLEVLARLHERAGHRTESTAALEEAIEFRETIRDRSTDPESRAQVLSRSARLYYKLASELALAESGGDLARAFTTMEALRARTMLDHLQQDASQTGSPAGGGPDADELARTVEVIASVQSRLADPSLTEPDRDAALRELERLEAQEAELASRIARADPAWARARRPRVAQLGEVRGWLGADEALILLQLPPPVVAESWALVVTGAGERVVRLEPFTIGSVLALYLGAIESRAEPPAEMASAIEKALLSPLIEALPPEVRRLVIVPDGPVARLPLAALPDPRSGRPLIERYELSVAPSATAWLALGRSGADPLRPAALGLADVTRERSSVPSEVVRGGGFAVDPLALPRSRTEVRSMIAAVGGPSRGLYASEASEAALKRLDLAPFGIVHFATHALVNAAHPSRSAILLAAGSPQEDGFLQPREIATLDLAGKLVVLSACRSADGRELRGEGPLSLARVFLGAGARAVVGTIWPVRDSEAAALAGHFYDRLARGETAAAALAGAQRKLLAAGAPPAAWGGFVLIGDGDATLTPRARTWQFASTAARLGAIAGLAGLAAALAWLFSRKS